MGSGQLDFSTLRQALDTLSVNIHSDYSPEFGGWQRRHLPRPPGRRLLCRGCGSSLGRSSAVECSENHHFPREDDEMGEALGQMMIEELNKPPPPAPDDDAGAMMTLARRRRRRSQ